MNSLDQTTNFWDSVSDIYGENEMTTNKSDFEMDYVISNLSLDTKLLMSYGCADGSRDPITILKHIKPEMVIIGDISSKMLNIASTKISGNLLKIHEPLEDINLSLRTNYSVIKNIIGLYSINFFKEALKMYKENQNIIGSNFKIFPVFYEHNLISQGNNSMEFNINEYNILDVENYINNYINESNFFALSLITETGFISHYYKKYSLNNFFGEIIKKSKISFDFNIIEESRYIICDIRFYNSESENQEILVTMLNNVMGNIRFSEQINAIKNLLSFFK